jgi:Flp pilus assembly pilin Flp
MPTLRGERGAGLAEYSLLLLLIAIPCFVTMDALGAALFDLYETIRTTLFP